MFSKFRVGFVKYFPKNAELSKSTRNFSTSLISKKEQKINISGQNINYLKVGTGNTSLILLPGAIGTIWTDFRPQIEKLNKEKFTIIAWDPPGYGKSRPPDRNFAANFYEQDANSAQKLMLNLGFEKFSLLGWSDGGISSLFLAAKYPENVEKMVVIGSNSYILPHEVKIYENIRDLSKWSEKMKAPLLEIYGEDYLQKIWESWVDAMIELYHRGNGNICTEILPQIKCPTLIVHGKKDKMCDIEHAEFLNKNIANSKVRYFDEGGHNLHLRYAEEFNELLESFLAGQ